MSADPPEVEVWHADARDALAALPDGFFDSVVTDPPYALVSIGKRFGGEGAAPTAAGVYARASAGFMGRTWDTGETAFDPAFWREVWRVVKPGSWVAAFGGTRAVHRLACAIEDAGFEIRDRFTDLVAADTAVQRFMASLTEAQAGAFLHAIEQSQFGGELAWMFGSGFPKSHALAKAIDKAVGAERPVIGTRTAHDIAGGNLMEASQGRGRGTFEYAYTQAATAEARAWEGWGTALKPAVEPIVLARKPLDGTVAANVLRHGVGALNIDGCRIGAGGEKSRTDSVGGFLDNAAGVPNGKGRWPANVLQDGSAEVIAGFPAEAGGGSGGGRAGKTTVSALGDGLGTSTVFHADAGSAARFFYSAKADAADRIGSAHPTVKPVDLMAWLIRLITPPGGRVLDPFAGSGSTGQAAIAEGMSALLIEREADYAADIRRRLAWAKGEGRLTAQERARVAPRAAEELPLFGGPEIGGGGGQAKGRLVYGKFARDDRSDRRD